MQTNSVTFCDLSDQTIDKHTSLEGTLKVGGLHGGRFRTIEEFHIHPNLVPNEDWKGTVYVLLDGETRYDGEQSPREGDVVGVEFVDVAKNTSEFIQRDALSDDENKFMCRVERELLWKNSYPYEVEE